VGCFPALLNPYRQSATPAFLTESTFLILNF
jgi:hypothetical protein